MSTYRYPKPEVRSRGNQCCIAVLLVLLSALSAHAQNYAIDWFTIDGGGGTSTNGGFAATGTIGQSDAAKLSGGSFGIQGGFWSIIAAIQTPGAPMLSIVRSGASVTVSWDAGVTGFVLEEAASLSTPTAWQPVAGAPNNSITVTPSPGNRFYRLRAP